MAESVKDRIYFFLSSNKTTFVSRNAERHALQRLFIVQCVSNHSTRQTAQLTSATQCCA